MEVRARRDLGESPKTDPPARRVALHQTVKVRFRGQTGNPMLVLSWPQLPNGATGGFNSGRLSSTVEQYVLNNG
jgi:hypothetical protein